nr:hypothetical protein [Tanacetum cinerariifolium]
MTAPTMTPSTIATITTTNDDGEEGDDDDDDQEVVRDDDKDDENDDEEEGEDDEQEYNEEEYDEEIRDEESFDPIPKTLENSNDKGNERFASNVLSLLSNPNSEPKLGRSWIRELRNIVGGSSALLVVVIVAMVEGVIVGAVIGRGATETSYAVVADLSEMELKKILIEKMEGNKSIQRSDEQRNLYKALVEAYESDKIILDTYGETVTLKRRHDDDADKDEEPSAGPDQGSKRHREGKEPESASAQTETATRSADRSTEGTKSRQASASESTLAEEPMQTTF